jgi:hypothetical protein
MGEGDLFGTLFKKNVGPYLCASIDFFEKPK